MKAIPYLSFDGTCRQAFELYQQLLGGNLFVMTNGESPMAGEIPPEHHDRVMHAYLEAGDLVLMGGDAPGERYSSPTGFSINLQTDSVDEGRRIFDTLADGGNVVMPFEGAFWVERFGMVTDRFGTPWMVNAGEEKV